MKKFIIVLLATLSIQAVADMTEYTGSNKGEACSIRLDLSKDYVQIGDIGLLARNKTTSGSSLILEGGAEFVDARVTLSYGSNKELSTAKLETRNMLIPFYRTKLICTNLVRTK